MPINCHMKAIDICVCSAGVINTFIAYKKTGLNTTLSNINAFILFALIYLYVIDLTYLDEHKGAFEINVSEGSFGIAYIFLKSDSWSPGLDFLL